MGLTDMELGWVAGIIEGEGSIFHSWRMREGVPMPQLDFSIKVSMTDEDVVRRLHEVTGIGNFNGPIFYNQSRSVHHKPTWSWAVTKQSDAISLLVKILPLLGDRRTEAADKLLGAIELRKDFTRIRKGD